MFNQYLYKHLTPDANFTLGQHIVATHAKWQSTADSYNHRNENNAPKLQLTETNYHPERTSVLNFTSLQHACSTLRSSTDTTLLPS